MIRLLIDLDADFMLFYLCALATIGVIIKFYQVFLKERKS
jgi:hypothetical protein